jgi:hypothetical protein
MTTDDLIRALEADRHVRQRTSTYPLISLLCGTSFVALIVLIGIGFRKEIVTALTTFRFIFKILIVVVLMVVLVGMLFRSYRPTISLGIWGRLLLIPILLLCVGVLAELAAVPRSDWITRLIGLKCQKLHDDHSNARKRSTWHIDLGLKKRRAVQP